LTGLELRDVMEALRVTRQPRSWFQNPQGDMANPEDWYTWDHHVAYGANNAAPYLGRRNATQSTDKRWGNTLFLDTAAGANLVWEAVRSWGITTAWAGQAGGSSSLWSVPFFWAMRINRGNPGVGAGGEKYQGISWGPHWDVNTPWQVNYMSSPNAGNSGKVGLHFNHTTQTFQLMVYSLTDSFPDNPPTLHTCTVQPLFTVDTNPAEFALLYVPGRPTPSEFGFLPRYSRLCAMVNGEIIHDLFDDVRVNEISAVPSVIGPGIYWTNGSNAGSNAQEACYYKGIYWCPIPMPGTG
jgi:hypothetical protein